MSITAARKKAKTTRGKGRPKSDREKVGRDNLVTATRELLQEMPYTEITRRSVATKAGVVPGLIRYYFDDLTLLLTEILKDMIKEMRQELVEISNRPLSPKEKLRLRIKYLVRFFADNPAFHQMFVDLVIYADGEWAEETRRNLTKIAFGEFSALANEAKADQDITESVDTRFLYILFFGAAEFFTTGRPIFEQLFNKKEWNSALADEYADFLANLILRGIEPR